MGFFTRASTPLSSAPKLAAALDAVGAQVTASHGTMPVLQPASPFAPTNDLQAVVWADLLGEEFRALTRAAAMSIPAVARHRHLIAGVVGKSPLVCLEGETRVPTPRWATRTDGELSPYHRMLWTADDLIFYGWSVWIATRAGTELESAERIAPERWETDEVGRILVDGHYVNRQNLILIPGPHEGILTFGASALRRSLDNLQAAANAARNPSAYLELHYTGEVDIPEADKNELLDGWAAARRGERGGVAWTNRAIEVKEHGTHESHLLIEGRNADAVDVARLMSNPAAMADATSSGASLTYETTEGRNGQFLDYGAALYMDAIAARLSMDDVVPEGLRIAFDTSAVQALSAPTTGPSLED